MKSYSDLATFQRCPKKYEYYAIQRLASPDAEALRYGSLVHEALAALYRGENWREHTENLYQTVKWHNDYEDVQTLVEEYEQHAREVYQDFDNWEVLHVEESFVHEGIGFTPDLVVRQRTTGDVWVVDHKTTSRFPEDEWEKVTNLQHLLYVYGVRRIYPETRGFIFNWLLRVKQGELKLRKDGKVANLTRVNTTFSQLMRFIRENNVPMYPELEARLEELRDGSTRFARTVLTVTRTAAENAWREAKLVARLIDETPEDGFYRVVDFGCRWCPYETICSLEYLGYDVDPATVGLVPREPGNRDYKEV
jgi:hypothetical protein